MPRLGASAGLPTLVIEASSKTLESNQLPLWLPPFGDVVTTPSSCCQESPFCPKARNSGFAVGWPMSRLVRTPGACTIIDCSPARPVGISSSVSLVSCVRVDVAATSTIGASPDPRELVLHGIGADRQRRQAIFADLVGDIGDLRDLEGQAGCRDGHARQHAAAFVRHLADDARVLRECLAGRWAETDHGENKQKTLVDADESTI